MAAVQALSAPTVEVRSKGLLTFGIMAAVIMQVLDTTIANVALPHMRSSLGASQDEINWVLTSYIVAAAIAILTKDFISNIINGLIIMFSDQLEIGDKIHIGKSTGFIRDITLSNIMLKNDTGEIIIIPNSMVLTSEVINYSKNNAHQMIFDSELPYSTELQLSGLEEKLNEVLKSFSEYVFMEGSQLNVLERKADTILVRYQFPIKSGEKATEIQVRKVINQALIDWSNEKRKA